MNIINAQNLELWYGENKALKDISISIPEKSIMAFIGPSGCGKSTFLKYKYQTETYLFQPQVLKYASFGLELSSRFSL